MPTYNNASFLQETIDSILTQDYKDYEIILVDDGSTDNTKEILEAYSDKIKYLYQENSKGCSKPRNVGIEAANGEYIAIFDSDDLMLPEKIMLQAEMLDKNPDVNLVFTDFCNFERERVHTNHLANCVIFNSLPKQKAGDNGYVLNSEETYETLLIENFVGASSMMFRKSVGSTIGGFDETLDSSEDIDFSLKMVQTGKVGFINKVCHLRRLHGNSMSARTEKVLTRKLKVYCGHLPRPKSAESQRRLIGKVADIHCSLAYFYRENSRYREAFSAYVAGLKMRPGNWSTYKGVVKLLWLSLLTGRHDQRRYTA